MLFYRLRVAAEERKEHAANRRRRRAKRGMILLDVLMALLLTALVFLATVRVLMRAAAAADGARQNAIAVQCARQVLENVRLYKMPQVSTGTYSATYSSTNLTAMGLVPQLAQLNQGAATLVVSTYAGRPAIKQAVVIVQWRAGNDTAVKSRTLTALLCSGGVAP